jgi:hypothetical protein
MDYDKLCIFLRSLNVHHFGMAEATKLKFMANEVIFNDMISTLNFIKSY